MAYVIFPLRFKNRSSNFALNVELLTYRGSAWLKIVTDKIRIEIFAFIFLLSGQKDQTLFFKCYKMTNYQRSEFVFIERVLLGIRLLNCCPEGKRAKVSVGKVISEN